MTRVALVGGAATAQDLATTGKGAFVVPLRRPAPLAVALEARGFSGELAGVPGAVAALLRARPEIVHAFSPAAALAGRIWRARAGGALAFTCVEELRRERLADRRLALRLLSAAVQDSDAVLAADDAVRASLERWLGVEAPVLELTDTAGHERLYRRLARH